MASIRVRAAAFVTIASLAASAATRAAPPQPLFDPAHRTLVVAAGSRQDTHLLQQDRWLAAGSAPLAERAVVVVHILGDQVAAPAAASAAVLDAHALRQQLGVAAGAFAVVLVGKDGTVKLRQAQPISVADLVAVIDAMPMRQREIRAGR